MPIVIQWQQRRCLDHGVWNFIRTKLNPKLIPLLGLVQQRFEELQLVDPVRIQIFFLTIELLTAQGDRFAIILKICLYATFDSVIYPLLKNSNTFSYS